MLINNIKESEQSYIYIPINNQEELMGQYIAGFVDGEGCFSVQVSKHKTRNNYLSFYPNFTIQLNILDLPLLEKIQKTLQCGRIYYNKRDRTVNLKVYRQSDLLNKIIPFFDKYQLQGCKKKSFELFKEAMLIFAKKQHTTNDGRNRLEYLRTRINKREYD